MRLSLHLYILLAYYKSRQARRQRWYFYLKLIFKSSSFLHTMIKQLVNPSTPRVEIRIIKTSSDPRLNNEIVQSERLAQKPRFESKSKFTFAYLLRAFSFPMIISIDHNIIFCICAATGKTWWGKHYQIYLSKIYKRQGKEGLSYSVSGPISCTVRRAFNIWLFASLSGWKTNSTNDGK